MKKTKLMDSLPSVVDAVIEHVGPNIVLATPMGIGKPNHLINALYRRVVADPSLSLKILTALSLERPVGKSDLEQRFLTPFVERVFGDYPDLDYLKDSRARRLPKNVEIREFFVKTGDYLGNAPAQQNYIYSNYSHAGRDMVIQGANVLMQAIAVDESSGSRHYSLSSNPDVTLDLMSTHSEQIMTVGAVNRRMPFMPNDAEVDASQFDLIVDCPESTHELFAPPNMKIDPQDYAISLWASTLVPDGGTLQIGIGSLGDGIAQALLVREQQNAEYRDVLGQLQRNTGFELPSIAQTGRFEQGLYGCSEMFVNGFLWLIRAGIIRREVYNDIALQRLIREQKLEKVVSSKSLRTLLKAGRIHARLTEKDVEFLKHFGLFHDGVRWSDGQLSVGEKILAPDLTDTEALEAICASCLGTTLQGGYFMHGGFFLGPRDFYQSLRDMPEDQLRQINMTGIRSINELLGHEALAGLQRKDARFINTTMMVTLLGAAISDGLDSGQMVSGVGGQYNFVAMGHALPDARSILLLRSWRTKNDKVTSNIVWNYGHQTIPRHLRDIVITEYGIADLRGQADNEVIKRLLAVADSRFQAELLASAKANGKLEADYQIPPSRRRNVPQAIEQSLTGEGLKVLLPDFPFGTDFTNDELVIARALTRLKHLIEHPLELLLSLATPPQRSSPQNDSDVQRQLARMGMTGAATFKERLTRSLFVRNL
jgi:acyl-CoA hydrolase